MERPFLDTNVLVYAFSDDPRSAIAEALLSAGPETSVQALNEFANVARRKLGFAWPEVRQGLAAIRTLCRAIHPLDLEVHDEAIGLAADHGFALFDALIVASALRAGCTVLHSEDMQHDRVIGGLGINNPFR